MRAELNKGPVSVVFVWGAFGILTGDVSIYTYRSMKKISVSTYSMSYGRDLWASLVFRGYHQRDSKDIDRFANAREANK